MSTLIFFLKNIFYKINFIKFKFLTKNRIYVVFKNYYYKIYYIHNSINKLYIYKLVSNVLKILIFIALIDFLILDDEGIFEPIEWTFVQTWMLYGFIITWIYEAISVSQFGSFTGRDKRVYNGLFKAYWLIELFINFNLFLVCVFITTPFYFELTYPISYIVVWWSWYNKNFFLKFLLCWIFIDIISNIILQGLKWLNWKKLAILALILTIIILYLFIIQALIVWFAYFTDIIHYKKTNWNDYIKLSHFPQKWGWGDYDRDHFNYHKTTLNFWFKNDNMIASSLFFINILVFFWLFLTLIQWLMVLRFLISSKTIYSTYIIYGISTIKMYFNFIFFLLFFSVMSFIYQFTRLTSEFNWLTFFDNIYNIILLYL